MFTRSIQSMTENENIPLGFLIFPGFPMACLRSLIEPLRVADEISGSPAALRRRHAEAYGVTLEEDRNRINMFRMPQNAPVPSG